MKKEVKIMMIDTPPADGIHVHSGYFGGKAHG